jgi:hypothetical protein
MAFNWSINLLGAVSTQGDRSDRLSLLTDDSAPILLALFGERRRRFLGSLRLSLRLLSVVAHTLGFVRTLLPVCVRLASR